MREVDSGGGQVFPTPAGEPLDERSRDHPLAGNGKGYRERHLQPDWSLIYRITGDELHLMRTGSHNNLFGR